MPANITQSDLQRLSKFRRGDPDSCPATEWVLRKLKLTFLSNQPCFSKDAVWNWSPQVVDLFPVCSLIVNNSATSYGMITALCCDTATAFSAMLCKVFYLLLNSTGRNNRSVHLQGSLIPARGIWYKTENKHNIGISIAAFGFL